MKLLTKLSTTSLLCLCSLLLMGQNNANKNRLYLEYSFWGQNMISHHKSEDLIGARSFNAKKYWGVELNYNRNLWKNVSLESGVQFYEHNVLSDPNAGAMFDKPSHHIYFHLLSVPVGARIDFLKYFHAHVAALLDFDVKPVEKMYNQTGLGAQFGLGASFPVYKQVSLTLKGVVKFRNRIPFKEEDHDYRYFLTENGFKLGLCYTW